MSRPVGCPHVSVRFSKISFTFKSIFSPKGLQTNQNFVNNWDLQYIRGFSSFLIAETKLKKIREGGGVNGFGTSYYGVGVVECVTECDRRMGRGSKKIGKSADVVYGRLPQK